MLLYRNGVIEEVQPRIPDEGEVGWVHLVDPSEEQVHRLLGEIFNCHPLVMEDVLHFGQRPKLDHYEGPKQRHAMMSFYALRPDLSTLEFSVIMSDRFVITVVREEIDELTTVHDRVKEYPEILASVGTLIYRLLDHSVDKYFNVVDSLEERMDALQEQVFDHPEAHVAHDIFQLKRQLQRVRRLASEGRNVVGILSHETFPYTDSHHTVYFVDVYDHASRVVDALDSVRDALSGLLDLQTAQRANRMNEVMKTLTIISTIFLPLSFIVGLYGMNFHDIPELTWSFGYIYVWALMILVTIAFVVYFRKKGWW